MRITKIRMRLGCQYSDNVLEIDSVYIPDCINPRFYKKEAIHDYIKEHPGSIYVDRYPYPKVVHAVSVNGEKYIRSEPNDTVNDNLLKLPRE